MFSKGFKLSVQFARFGTVIPISSGAEDAIAYIRKKTHLQVKRRLLDLAEEEVKLDFSQLVQELLEVWVLFEQGAEPDSLIALTIYLSTSIIYFFLTTY